ncbi:DapH/DapD/GlmU-related protein [Halioxenophilus aromaticivorans]|uniref:Acetyltransferase n=1 Tax=Halioxenophilus aromaticivorans TaxID=1306992 RepID=A0AAV3TZM3_9ALTE
MTEQSQPVATSHCRPLVIYGNGAMAAVYDSYFRTRGVIAFTVESRFKHSDTFADRPLIAFEQLAETFVAEKTDVIVAVGYSAMNSIRARIADEVKAIGFQLGSYLAPGFSLHTGSSVGEHCVVLEHCSMHCHTRVGRNVFISSGVNIGHHCQIGSNVWINAGVALAGGVTIGDNCFLGVNASVAHGVTLAPGTYVGANTLVSKNTEDNQVVVTPAGEVYDLDSRVFLAALEAAHAN